MMMMMSKFIPVHTLKCVELVDVNYHNQKGELEGMYAYSRGIIPTCVILAVCLCADS